MAEWTGTILTTAGRNLLAKTLTGQAINFSRAELGDGVPPVGTDVHDLTNVISPKLSLPARSSSVVGDGTAILELQLTNQSLTTGFFAKEIGIFAMDGATEILFAYDNSGDKSDYIPAWGTVNPINLLLYVYVVIDSATNVTITIDNSLLFVTKEEFQAHTENVNHPYIGNTVTTTDKFWVYGTDGKLHPIILSDVQTLIMGSSANTIPILSSRINQVEIEQSNIALKLSAMGDCPDSNLLLVEDFSNPDKIDRLQINIKSIVAGDNGIDLETLANVISGSWYWISDGINQEYIQVKSCIKNGNVNRILTESNVIHTYNVPNAIMYRTTSSISNGVAYGSGNKEGFNWNMSNYTWSGINSNSSVSMHLNTTQKNLNSFTITGNILFTVDGLITVG